MLSDTITRENVKQLVANFYGRVRKHEALGPIFNGAIGTTDELWDAHIEHITKFWEKMLLDKEGFSGQPLKTHINLPSFPPERFADWLGLWEQTLNEIYTPQVASGILAKANQISQRFKSVIYDGGEGGGAGCGCGCGH